MMQPILNHWRAYEPNLSEGLQAIGEASNTCAESRRKLVDSQKPNLSVVNKIFSYFLYPNSFSLCLSLCTSMDCTLNPPKMP